MGRPIRLMYKVHIRWAYTWHNCLWNERKRKSYRPLDFSSTYTYFSVDICYTNLFLYLQEIYTYLPKESIYPFSARRWRKSYVYFFRSTFSWKRCTYARGEIGKYIYMRKQWFLSVYMWMCRDTFPACGTSGSYTWERTTKAKQKANKWLTQHTVQCVHFIKKEMYTFVKLEAYSEVGISM